MKHRNTWMSGLLLLTASVAALASTADLADRFGKSIYAATRPVGMVMVVVNGKEVAQRFYGQVHVGSRQAPDENTVVRIASLSKLMTSEVLVSLAQERKLGLDDPLQKYAPAGVHIPTGITLLNLATHTSGLPREQPGMKPEDAPVFSWPDRQTRWNWMGRVKTLAPAGRSASYSNLAYDYLADALEKAGGKPYEQLLRERVTGPLGMRDTTFQPSAAQCARLMDAINASPCLDSRAAIGSGGVYSTARDMQRWLKSQLGSAAGRSQQMVFQRAQLNAVRGMDVAGQADALGLGWVYMQPKKGLPAILQKTGGGGGFISYVALVPHRNIAVFVSMGRSNHTHFPAMSNGANKLLAALADADRLPLQQASAR